MNANATLPDKKHAPKKTGKRGIKALDPGEDFDKPVKKDAATEIDKPTAHKKGAGSLLAEQAPRAKVVGERMEVNFRKTECKKVPKLGVALLMHMSFPLDKEHKDVLPKIVIDGYSDVAKKGRKCIILKDIPFQKVKLYYASDGADEPWLEFDSAALTNASVALIERKGEGSVKKVIRFAFTLMVKYTDSSVADKNVDNNYWITFEETQAKLFDEDEEE
jgi:hypothetical protein